MEVPILSSGVARLVEMFGYQETLYKCRIFPSLHHFDTYCRSNDVIAKTDIVCE